jgi:hypothetical protein
MVLAEGMLFMELAKVKGDWLWHNDRIGSMPGVKFGCFAKLVVERVKDRIENITGGEGPIEWCGRLL